MNTAKKKHEDIKKRTEEDLAFERKVSRYSKDALSMAMAQMTSNEGTREWILDYLHDTEDLLGEANLGRSSMRGSILESINYERINQEEAAGPDGMPRQSLAEWTDRLALLTTKANSRAKNGQQIAAMKLILWMARDAVACLEDRIDSVADHHKDSLEDAITKVTEHPDENVNALLEIRAGNDPEKEVEMTTLREIGSNGVAYRGYYYWASWMADYQGCKVKLRFPSKPRSIHVLDADTGNYLGQAYRMKCVAGNLQNSPADDADTSPAGESQSSSTDN